MNTISPGARVPDIDINRILTHAWPGNVRELRNCLEQLLVLRTAPALGDDALAVEPMENNTQVSLHVAVERLERHYISWVSPLARALMKKGAGERAVLHAPGGTEQLQILDVYYEEIPVEPFREPAGAESART